MKRAPWYVVAGAAAGFAGVFGLHSRPGSPPSLASAKSPHGGTGTARPGTSSPGKGSGTSAGGGQSAAPSGPARSATGKMEQYGYGELDVKVTVTGSHITDVSVPVLRTAEPYSQQLADQVIPVLKSQVMSAQGASINGVSGATYTSEAYALSLQAALDKLHVK